MFSHLQDHECTILQSQEYRQERSSVSRGRTLCGADVPAEVCNLKVASTEVAAATASRALQLCGIAGIHRDTDMVIERIVRDAHASLVMFGNDGLLRQNADVLIARKSI